QLDREHTSTNADIETLDLKAITSGDMVDGFGSSIRFQIEDSAGVENTIGELALRRDGADNEGSYQFKAGTNGAETFLTIQGDGDVIVNSGNVGIGTTDPSSFKLQVAGDIGPQTDSAHNIGSDSVRWANGYFDDLYATTIHGEISGTVPFSEITSGTNTQADMVIGTGASLKFNDDIALTFGTNNDITIQYDENGTDELQIAGNTQFDDSVDIAGDLDVDNINLSGNTIAATDASGLFLYDDGGNGIFVKDGGNVGIGTTNPERGLHVANGDILLENGESILARRSGGGPGDAKFPIIETENNSVIVGRNSGYYMQNLYLRGGNGNVIIQPNDNNYTDIGNQSGNSYIRIVSSGNV
ncbi:MAG: hypothetical protein ACTSPB_26890, partial [Candidatus Thorarchaeota archaeon]